MESQPEQLPATKEKEISLTNSLMGLKKDDLSIDEYIKRLNSLCDNLAAIGKPVSGFNKCFFICSVDWDKNIRILIRQCCQNHLTLLSPNLF